jgi:tRNA splicing ligase
MRQRAIRQIFYFYTG